MQEEFYKLLFAIAMGLGGGLVFSVPVIAWRAFRRQPLFPKGKKLDSPKILYLGVAFFGVMATISFIAGMPFFGSFFLLILSAYAWGLIAYKRGWRG